MYRSGAIEPAYYQNEREVVPGMVTAAEEPHRPGVLDLFVSYDDPHKNFPPIFPPNFAGPESWVNFLDKAEEFVNAQGEKNARFSVLRLWSAPHFCPLMIGPQNRQGNSFLDSAGRVWVWKFVPKNMPGSEFSAHFTMARRLDMLKTQFEGRVFHRGDLVLVMGKDADDLFNYSTAVMFALQTKPWFREVDLWKSFVNIDIDLMRDLDPVWLD